MTYAQWITKIRNQTGDTRRRVHVDWIGDGSTTVFQMPDDTFPVLDQAGTYTVKVAGSAQTEVTHYSLDKETGTLVMVSAPTNGQEVTIDSSAIYLTDDSWLKVTNDVISSLGDDFFKEFVDDSNFVTTANMLSLALTASQPKCIAVYDFSWRVSTSDDWTPVENICNWRFDRDNNAIYVSSRNIFPTAGELLKVRGLKTYTQGTAVSDTLDVQDRYLTILEYGCLARYWRWRYKHVVELISKLSTESTRTPLQELIMLSDRFDRLYEQEKAKLKPAKPPRMIPVLKEGVGRA